MNWRLGLTAVLVVAGCAADSLLRSQGMFFCQVSPLGAPVSGTPYTLSVDTSATSINRDSASVSGKIPVRVERNQFFGAVPISNARVTFTARTASTSVSADSARTDSLGRAETLVTFVGTPVSGDSIVVDVAAFVNTTEVNGSPLAFAVCVI